MHNAMSLTKNQLIEHLLGLEIEIRFISLREAKAIYAGACDDALLEAALHVPMRLAIDGENDIAALALALGQALNAHYPSAGAAQAVVSLFLEKNQVAKAAPKPAMIAKPRQLTPSEITSLREEMWNAYQELLMLSSPKHGHATPEEDPPIKDEKS